MRQAKPDSGFTLIELLIVVAIIAILAMIAVPNFLEAQTRSKVARVRTDMRTIVVALEAYFVDWNGYCRHRDFDPSPPNPPPEQQDPWWRGLTTPVAYMGPVPKDPFAKITSLAAQSVTAAAACGGYIHYEPWQNTWDGIMADDWGPWIGFVPEMRSRGLWYFLWCVGPDGDTDCGAVARGGRGGSQTDKGQAMAAFYDPTNGTISSGDLLRFGPGSSEYMAF